jgi:hypothetical protein
MSSESAHGTATDAEPLLEVAEAAARLGIQPGSWRAGVSRGYFPPPDEPDTAAPKQRRRPRWRLSTVDKAIDTRPGQGRRTDLAEARKDRGRRITAELAEPRRASAAAVQEWLRTNHRALLAVADVLVDHRDELLTSVTDDERLHDELAGAIDRAGEAMTGHPSRLLAAAVTYAHFLLRPDGGVRTSDAVREVLNRHARLHVEFNRLRSQERRDEA